MRAGDFPFTDSGASCLDAALVSCQTTRRHSVRVRSTFTRSPQQGEPVTPLEGEHPIQERLSPFWPFTPSSMCGVSSRKSFQTLAQAAGLLGLGAPWAAWMWRRACASAARQTERRTDDGDRAQGAASNITLAGWFWRASVCPCLAHTLLAASHGSKELHKRGTT